MACLSQRLACTCRLAAKACNRNHLKASRLQRAHTSLLRRSAGNVHLSAGCCRIVSEFGAKHWFQQEKNRAQWMCYAHDGAQGASLAEIAQRVQDTFIEVCVENEGRPAAAALGDFCGSIVEAVCNGHSMERLVLELEFVAGSRDGFRLTSSEAHYRKQWIDTVYISAQMLTIIQEGESAEKYIEDLQLRKPEDEGLMQIVQRTLKGTMTGEEQLMVKFDRALATKGASGGVASEKRTIAPQFVPVTQLVLLTKKVYIEKLGM